MLLALPILVPLATAIALQLAAAPAAGCSGWWPSPVRSACWRRRSRCSAEVTARGIQVLQVASWPAPFGITLVADLFSALLVVMVGIIAVAVTASSFAGVDPTA